MYVQFCETDLFQQISSGEYFNISRDKTLDAKRKTNDWSKPLLNMNNHWFGGALCLFYGTRCKNKRKSSSLYGTQNFVLPSTRKQNSNKPSKYGGYRQICTRSGTYIEHPIGYTNLAPNWALYGIGSKLSRLRDSTRSGTPFMYPIGYTFYVPDRVHNIHTQSGTQY